MTQTTKQKSLLDFKSGGWVLVVLAILTLLAVLQMLWPVITGHPIHRTGNGVDVVTYNFNLNTALVPRSDIVASGMPKDGLHAMVDPTMWTVAQVDALDKRQGHLVSKDLVIGVASGPQATSEARAYPIGTLDIHEIVNDTLAGRPIAITYNPLCSSAAVFDRRVDGQTRTFGISGLLNQSNLLMYDRQRDPSQESLWCQLQFRAITGPAAAQGNSLALIPFDLTTWADWKTRHPNTLVLARDPDLNRKYKDDNEYNKNHYGSYFASDEIKFPVDPLWNDGNLAKKTRVLAVRVQNQWTVYTLPKLILSADASGHWSTTQSGVTLNFAIDPSTETARLLTPPPDTIAIPCFIFAWYAQHPDKLTLIR